MLVVKQELDADMTGFGYEIVNVLVTYIIPDAKVKSAMNDINAAASANRSPPVRAARPTSIRHAEAEAEAESKALQGEAIVNQRKAIVEALLVPSIEQIQKVCRRRYFPAT